MSVLLLLPPLRAETLLVLSSLGLPDDGRGQ